MNQTPLLGPVFIADRPLPKGSLRNVAERGEQAVLVNDNPGLTRWENKIAVGVASAAPHLLRAPITDPVELHVEFRIARPKRPTYPGAPVGKGMGDLDKLTRAVGDGLTLAGVWRDDAIVSRIVAEKVYTTGQPGVEITLWPYTTSPTPSPEMVTVRLWVGRTVGRIGSVGELAELPGVLRAAATEFERTAGRPQ